MSADLWLELDAGGPEPVPVCDSVNVTYNLTPMLRAAGYPGHEQMRGAPASEAGGIFRSVADRLRATPSAFVEFVPPNGWGSVEWAIEFCDEMANECTRAPSAHIAAWL